MLNRNITPSELEQTLVQLGAKLRSNEVHALYLGALTSTKLGIGPQVLLRVIVGEDTPFGENVADANAVIGVLFGYWNKLAAEREAGRSAYFLGGNNLPEASRQEELHAFAERRRTELQWFVRGIDAGGDDPLEWGASGREHLKDLAETGGLFDTYVEVLERSEPASSSDLQQARELLLKTSSLCEKIMTSLMEETDLVRREALATSLAMEGKSTDDGVRIGGMLRVGRNEPCPCGSGKKWKRCCGGVTQTH